jgi:hypothetical protein
MIKLWSGATCQRPRVVLFSGEHDFVLKRKGKKGYVARCRFCGAYLKRKKGKRQ